MALAKRIIIAAGHGGGDSGAAARGTTEAAETIQITGRLVKLLKDDGRFDVVHVPDILGLVDTINWINARYKKLNDGLAIEVHKNSGGGTGNEVWTPSYPDGTIKSIATKINSALASATKLANRGVKYAQNNRWGRLGFCDDTNTYALLVEAGFIDVDSNSNVADQKFAEGIYKGILSYYGLSPKPAPAPKPAPTPSVPKAVRLPKAIKFTTNTSPTTLVDVKTGKIVKVFRKGEEYSAYASISYLGKTYYVTYYSYSNDTRDGILSTYLDEVKPPVAKPTPVIVESVEKFKPVRVMQIINDTNLVKLATGAKQPGTDLFQKNRVIKDVAARITMSNGKKYYQTEYGVSKGVDYGFEENSLKDWVAPKEDISDTQRIDRLEQLVQLIVDFLKEKFGFNKQ